MRGYGLLICGDIRRRILWPLVFKRRYESSRAFANSFPPWVSQNLCGV